MPRSSPCQSSRRRATPTSASNSQEPEITPTTFMSVPHNRLATPPARTEDPTPTSPAPSSAPRLGRGVRGSFNNSQANVPLYGSLNVRDAIFYINATVSQLKTIVRSAPRHLRSHLPSSPTKDMLLEAVFAMRTEKAVNSRRNQRSPDESLQELMNLQLDQLKALSVADSPHLIKLMKAALQAHPQNWSPPLPIKWSSQ